MYIYRRLYIYIYTIRLHVHIFFGFETNSVLGIGHRAQNRNSVLDAETKTEIRFWTQSPKPKFGFGHRAQNRNSVLATEPKTEFWFQKPNKQPLYIIHVYIYTICIYIHIHQVLATSLVSNLMIWKKWPLGFKIHGSKNLWLRPLRGCRTTCTQVGPKTGKAVTSGHGKFLPSAVGHDALIKPMVHNTWETHRKLNNVLTPRFQNPWELNFATMRFHIFWVSTT